MVHVPEIEEPLDVPGKEGVQPLAVNGGVLQSPSNAGTMPARYTFGLSKCKVWFQAMLARPLPALTGEVAGTQR